MCPSSDDNATIGQPVPSGTGWDINHLPDKTVSEVLIMSRENVYNFAAGPSTMPRSVLERAGAEISDYRGSGMSVMEISHRSAMFGEILEDAKSRLRRLMSIPDSHEILLLQGGGTLQFAAIPMNLMGEDGLADYAVTGNFSGIAAREATKYGRVNIACDSSDRNHCYIPSRLTLSKGARYFYYCANNTIFGTEWRTVPEVGDETLVCDMSSDILSRPVDVSKFGLIYAGAQKNMAPAGLTVVIIKKSLAGRQLDITPSVMSYDTLIEKNSMLNTPPCWCIYMLSLMLEWLESMGGVSEMDRLRRERSAIVYDVLDNSRLYKAHAERDSRSCMNVTFSAGSTELDALFVKDASSRGLVNLKGHRLTGGIRASLYNAMPVEGAVRLAEFMKQFEVEHHV